MRKETRKVFDGDKRNDAHHSRKRNFVYIFIIILLVNFRGKQMEKKPILDDPIRFYKTSFITLIIGFVLAFGLAFTFLWAFGILLYIAMVFLSVLILIIGIIKSFQSKFRPISKSKTVFLSFLIILLLCTPVIISYYSPYPSGILFNEYYYKCEIKTQDSVKYELLVPIGYNPYTNSSDNIDYLTNYKIKSGKCSIDYEFTPYGRALHIFGSGSIVIFSSKKTIYDHYYIFTMTYNESKEKNYSNSISNHWIFFNCSQIEHIQIKMSLENEWNFMGGITYMNTDYRFQQIERGWGFIIFYHGGLNY